ncbi:hypothetical protein Pmani_028749 [Petrolisthes manimaculis]|uniref:Uncharacterized protein n=1 Tax=Petrolisthes manimaculis TaxID=1843537 RepID=A0AAE1TXQ0_9EUCA|nr:hypothetical protein Pmani_028749 [Petrolisthes manimaculis]
MRPFLRLSLTTRGGNGVSCFGEVSAAAPLERNPFHLLFKGFLLWITLEHLTALGRDGLGEGKEEVEACGGKEGT